MSTASTEKWWLPLITEKLENPVWEDAEKRWLEESKHKRSIDKDIENLAWLKPYLSGMLLTDINRQNIEQLAKIREKIGNKPATINRMLALIRAILRRSVNEWEWLDKIPYIKLRSENNNRTRFLTQGEANSLVKLLPAHLGDMVTFSLATGLRQSNVTKLEWHYVDMERQHLYIPAEKSKSNKPLGIPLNAGAIAILEKRKGMHNRYVFTYRHKPIKQCTTKAWYKVLDKLGIEDFRWHDLRHTWASWHVQNGTPLHELQKLGGWESHAMVLRYAHLSSEHLQNASERISNMIPSIKQN